MGETSRDRGRRDHGADRQTGGEPFREGEDVGSDPVGLRGAERSAPADAALDLVEDERHAPAIADPARGPEEFWRAVARTGQPLHRLHDERRDRVVDAPARARRCRRNRHPAGQRHSRTPGAVLVALPVGHASVATVRPCQPPATETIVCRPVCFRARCSAFSLASAPELQKNTRPSGSGQRDASFSASSSRSAKRHRGRVEQQPFRLLGDGAHHVGMAVPGGGDGMAAVGVEPLVAVLVYEPRAVAAHGADRERRVHGEKSGRFARGGHGGLASVTQHG